MNNTEFEYFKFIRNHNNTNRYNILCDKSNINFLKKLKIGGFEVIRKSDYSVIFKVKKQLLRKLKLSKFKNEKETKSNNSRLLVLIKKSQNITKEDAYERYYSNSRWTISLNNDFDYEYGYDNFKINERKNRKDHSFNKSRVYNQKLKQYEKTKWFRK